MAKTKISEFSATPANNTDIDGINIAEGCAPSGINDAIRELMAQLKDWQSGTSNDPYVVGSSGSLTLNQGTANGIPYLNGSKVVTSGSALTFDGSTLATTGALTVDGNTTLGNASTDAVTVNGTATFNASPVISVTDNTNAALRITQLGTGNALLVEDSTNPDATPFVIDATGKINKGATTWYAAAGVTPETQLNGTGSQASIGLNAWQAGTNVQARLYFNRADSATQGDFTDVVDSGDNLGSIHWTGSDGTAFIEAASINAAVDGTPGTNDMPGRLLFSTTADGASTPTERMRIGSSGGVGIGGADASNVSLYVRKNVTGATSAYGVLMNGAIQSDVTSQSNSFTSQPSTAATAFTLTSLRHYLATQSTIGAGSTVTNQFGFSAASTLTGATNNYGFYSDIASGTGRYNFYANGTADNYLRGNLGLRTETPEAQLDVYTPSGDTGLVVKRSPTMAGAPYIRLLPGSSVAYLDATGALGFRTAAIGGSPAEVMRIDSSGNLLMGVTSGSGKIRMKQSADAHSGAFTLENFGNTNTWSFLVGSDNNLYFGYNATSRGVFNNSTGAYTTISDQRLKKDISEIQYGLNSVLALRPVSYLMKDQTEGANKTLGFIAQEVNQIVPESVLQMQDDFYGMDKEALIPVLVKAIQEQQAIITALTARVEALESN
jgi:hypothetical protein